MTLWQVVLLAPLQAATEFLPISSSGHLVIPSFLLSIPAVIGALLLKVAEVVGLDALYLAREQLARAVVGGRLFLFGWYCAILGVTLVVLQ